MDDFKVVPLSVAFGVEVIFEPQTVLDVVDFDGSPQIAVFESAVEDEHILLLRHVNRELFMRLPLSRKLRQMFEQKLIEIILEVSFPWLFGEEFAC